LSRIANELGARANAETLPTSLDIPGDAIEARTYSSTMHRDERIASTETDMLNAATPTQHPPLATSGTNEAGETAETMLWISEHEWLYELMRSERNVAPRFRMPDLISACVSQVFAKGDASHRLFGFLGSELILREPATLRRREVMWRPQYAQLQALQLSAANRYPNPQFQLDQLTTGCIALARMEDPTGGCTLRHARINIARRSAAAKATLSS
jgi:hypothetical protein